LSSPSSRHDRHGSRHRRHSSSSSSKNSLSGSESWTDTGDIGEQHDTDADPLRLQLPRDIEDELLANTSRRSLKHPKKVRIQDPSPQRRHRGSYSPSGLIDKEAIEIPFVPPRKPSRVDRCVGFIMSGRSGFIHGLTGKPLLYFTSIFVSLGVFLFGYDQGVMSGILTYVVVP
jgi:hypothetical protein